MFIRFVFFCIFPSFAFAQSISSVVVYSLDKPASDSFYLVKRSYTPSTTGRPDTLIESILFKDSIDFKEWVKGEKRYSKRKNDFKAEIAAESDTLASRYSRLVSVANEGFGFNLPGSTPPNNPHGQNKIPSSQSSGAWVVYTKNVATVEYVNDVGTLTKNALILNPDGTYKIFKPKKAKKK